MRRGSPPPVGQRGETVKLKSFTVQKYRSIIAAKRIPTGKTTILVGPNNEGKSNILRALVTAMNILTRERYARGQSGRIRGGLRNRRTSGRRLVRFDRSLNRNVGRAEKQ